jgi:hypothetical protein
MNTKMAKRISAFAAIVVALGIPVAANAQGRGGGRGGTPQSAAPIDLTGYWVSMVTEDWRYRMLTPPKGDYPSIPLNAEGRKLADAWDPGKDEAAGNSCKAYGAVNGIRQPGRLHITWDNENTLKLELDAGTQTRMLRFGRPQAPAGEATWQGNSVASWDFPGGRGARGPESQGGALKVVTRNMKPGYIQKNGVPYSENATLTEYYHVTKETNGDQWLLITTLVEDPTYLARNFQRSTHFKKEANGAKWDPEPCAAR